MARKIIPDTSLLRRTAEEVKSYRRTSRILPAVAGAVALLLMLIYVITLLYSRYGAFTVTVNKLDNINYALSLSEYKDFPNQTSQLNTKAAEEVTNIKTEEIPDNLDSETGGSKNGKNYVAYTFWCKNAGKNDEPVSYEYAVYIANMSKNVEQAVRVRVYVNGVATTYAHAAANGGAEPETTEFYGQNIVARDTISNFYPGDITRYTVVIWLDGDDPECTDNILGGVFKIDMTLSILHQ